MLCNMLKGHSLSLFEYHLSKRCGGEDIEVTDHELLELVIRDLGLDYISRRAIRVQKYYMRRCLFMGPTTTVQQFVERLNELNRYLLFSLKNILLLSLKMKLLRFWIKPSLQIGMKQ